jgi:hypothetical protein
MESKEHWMQNRVRGYEDADGKMIGSGDLNYISTRILALFAFGGHWAVPRRE